MSSGRYDLVIVGGGTAALVAALGAAGLGARVALIEAERTGGDCLWTGCVPSKRLIAAARAAHQLRTADRHGLPAVDPEVDLSSVMDRVRAAQDAIAPHDSPERLRREGVEVVWGRGRFDGPGRVVVDGRILRYRAALIATGSTPLVPPIAGLAAAGPLTTDTVWELGQLPGRLVILGGGPVGCELGQAFARLGSKVTLVEALDTLLPRSPPPVGRLLAERFAAEGIGVRTGVRADAVHGDGPASAVVLSDGSTVAADRILVAVGRRPSSDDLGLHTVGVATDAAGQVVVDDAMRTTGDRIFAAGDVTGRLPFTHVAAAQARVVVTNALFRTRRRLDHDRVPWAVFTDPEVARVGLDADAARRRHGDRVVVARFAYSGLDRAICDGDPVGFAELVGDARRRLVGATVVGPAASETIAEMAAWLATGRRIDDVSLTTHAYPTYAEGPARAADDVLRGRFFAPRVRRLVRPVLAVARRFDAPRG